MTQDLRGRSFLTLLDFTPDEIRFLIELGLDFKSKKRNRIPHKYLEGKNIVLLFEKTSTRTRCAFEVAGYDLGLGVTVLDSHSSQMGSKESIEDTACVLGRLFDAIEYRGFSQKTVEILSSYSGVPVYNGLTDKFHPTQMIADMMTLYEAFSREIEGRKLVFLGDARNNVANSLMVVCSKLGLQFVACGPDSQMPSNSLVETCKNLAMESGGSVTLTSSVEDACREADVIYTDIWLSMGEPAELWEERISLLEPFRVTEDVMSLASPQAVFLHCLPSFHDTNTTVARDINERFGIREMEVTDAVFHSDQSRVFDEAENRMHSIKALLYATLIN